MARRLLTCSNRCTGDRFEALNAPTTVDRAGAFVGVDLSRATFVCTECGGVAVDVAAAAREMRRAGTASATVLRCPSCGADLLPPEDDPLADLLECPECGVRFTPEEGSDRLHAGGHAGSHDAFEDLFSDGTE